MPPPRPPLPDVPQADWPRNPVDRFIAAAARAARAAAVARGRPRTLIRRLSFDLTGLPPTPAEVDAFVADHSPAAYEKLVDRLLASPHYGERMAMYWLDVVRYADTGGYHSDNERNVWLYRDYVIQAFNENKPFDQFTIEQLAGDLLPGGDRRAEDRLGLQPPAADHRGRRGPAQGVHGQVRRRPRAEHGRRLAGLDDGLRQCHDHKYDPFTTKDFYSFAAFFADVKEAAVGRQEQTPMPSPEQAAACGNSTPRLRRCRRRSTRPRPNSTPRRPSGSRRQGEAARAALPKPVAEALAVEPAKRSDQQRQAVAAYYRSIAPQLAAVRDKLAAASGRRTN